MTTTKKQTNRTPKRKEPHKIAAGRLEQRTEEARARVLDAMSELLHNPQTPVRLWNEISDFVCQQSNECDDGLYQSIPYLREILKSVPPEDLMGAARAREAEKGGGNGN